MSSTPSVRTVEDMLDNIGYSVDKRILVRHTDGTHGASHVKACKEDMIFYVQLDDDNVHVKNVPGEPVLRYSTESNMVPSSVENGVMEAVNDLGVNVLIECENGICTMIQESPDSEPQRVVMSVGGKSKSRILSNRGEMVSYPVVRYSELMSNCVDVEKLVREATARIRRSAFDKMQHDLKDVKGTMCDLNHNYNKFSDNFATVWKALKDQIADLVCWRNRLENKFAHIKKHNADPCNECNQLSLDQCDLDKYNKIIYNLKVRNEMLADLMRFDASLLIMAEEAATLNEQFKNQNHRLCQTFKNINSVFADE